MPAPHDADLVLTAIRLGCYMAEVRGRNRPAAPVGSVADVPDRAAHVLPLRTERTPTELRIEAQLVLGALAARLGVDANPDGGASYAAEVDERARALAALRENGETKAEAAWDAFAELIYKFDAHIQDNLAAKSDTQACGYQLGRGLAECFWALDPDVEDGQPSPAAWWFLLGEARCLELSKLLGRLETYMDPYTASAIAGSIEVWKHVAADAAWRSAAQRDLRRQIRRWYELLVLGQDPTTLIKPYALLRNYRVLLQAVRIFWGPLALAALGVGALAVLVALLGTGTANAVVNTLLGTLAVAGLSTAGLAARLTNAAQAMLKRLRQDAYTDLIALAITTAPPPPSASTLPGRSESDMMARLVSDRPVTPATAN